MEVNVYIESNVKGQKSMTSFPRRRESSDCAFAVRSVVAGFTQPAQANLPVIVNIRVGLKPTPTFGVMAVPHPRE